MKQALVLYGATDLGPPHFSGDILWRTGLKAPDPFPVIEIEGRVFLLLSPLEIERAEKEARGEAISISDFIKRSPEKTEDGGIALFLKENEVTNIVVPASFPYALGNVLEGDFVVEVRKPPFYPERAKKTDWEIAEIEKAQRAVETAVEEARRFLADCSIKGPHIYSGKEMVTSEMLRWVIDNKLFEQGFFGVDTIVASGIQAADPHCQGSGPLMANSAIVLDVFPLSLKTHYYADQTRTVFKGKPSLNLVRMYTVVMRAQLMAIDMIKDGVDGRTIQESVDRYFTSMDYPTDITKRPVEGFIHGVGHGVGIDIHEPPKISKVHWILQERNVVTVEPGLYYPEERNHIPAGGIRIEDMGVVEKDGFRNLTKMPKDLNWAVIL